MQPLRSLLVVAFLAIVLTAGVGWGNEHLSAQKSALQASALSAGAPVVPTTPRVPVWPNINPTNCFLRIDILEKKVGESVQFSLIGAQPVEGAAYDHLVSPYIPEDGGDYIVETWTGQGAQARMLGEYVLHSGHLLIVDAFDDPEEGGMVELPEAELSIIVPNNLALFFDSGRSLAFARPIAFGDPPSGAGKKQTFSGAIVERVVIRDGSRRIELPGNFFLRACGVATML